jgi:hypothetical protein
MATWKVDSGGGVVGVVLAHFVNTEGKSVTSNPFSLGRVTGTKFIFFTDSWRNHWSKVVNSPVTFAAVHSCSGRSGGFDNVLLLWSIALVIVAQALFQLTQNVSFQLL